MPTIKQQHIKLKRNSICPCDENMKLEEGDLYKRGKRKKYKHCCLKEIQDSEQQIRMLFHHDKRVDKAKKEMEQAIQLEKDHPILLPTKKVVTLNESKIIIP